MFIGFAGNLVVGVWVGRDDNKSLGKITGGTVPAQIWRNFMTSALAVDGAAARRCRPSSARAGTSAGRRGERKSPLPDEWSEPDEAIRESWVERLIARCSRARPCKIRRLTRWNPAL